MEIRSYCPSDETACISLFKSNVPEFFGVNELGEFEDFLRRREAVFLVAVDDGVVCGCGGYYKREHEGRLCWGMVARDLQRNGVGSELLLERLNRLMADIEIEAVAIETSQRSQQFFSRFGFCTDGEIVRDGFARGIDQIRMVITRDTWDKRITKNRCGRRTKPITSPP